MSWKVAERASASSSVKPLMASESMEPVAWLMERPSRWKPASAMRSSSLSLICRCISSPRRIFHHGLGANELRGSGAVRRPIRLHRPDRRAARGRRELGPRRRFRLTDIGPSRRAVGSRPPAPHRRSAARCPCRSKSTWLTCRRCPAMRSCSVSTPRWPNIRAPTSCGTCGKGCWATRPRRGPRRAG